jgi:hypothetical protein
MSLFGGVSAAPLKQTKDDSDELLKKGRQKSIKQYKKGLEAANPLYEQAAAQYSPYQATGTAANTMYGNALGVNGPGGNTAAVDAFHTAPGYNFMRDEALQGVERLYGQKYGYDSGNLINAIQERGTGLADQSYQQWMDNLFRGSGQGLQAAQGAAQANLAQGGMTADNYNNRANTFANSYGAQANNASQFGTNMTNLNAANQANQTAALGAGLSGLTSLFGAGTGGGVGSIGGSLFKSILG